MPWAHTIPPSIRELVLRRVVELLKVQQADEQSVPTVGRSHLPVSEQSQLPRQDVLLAKPPERFGEDVEQTRHGDQVSRTFTFAIVSKFKGPNAAGTPSLDEVADPLCTRVVRALASSAALHGSGYLAEFEGLPVVDVRELGTDFLQELGNVPLGQAHTYFAIEYETRRTDPTSAP